jgi:beta-lactamase regulating signal transducer with metallopeptidase domain
MIAVLMFSLVAAALVYLAGRKDTARDPRLTGLALALLAVFPLLVVFLPKFAVLPVVDARASAGSSAMVGRWIFGIWAVGFSVSLLRLGFAAARVSVWRRRSRWVANEGRVEIRVAEGLKGPVAAGVLRRVVLVPEAWNGWSDRVRRIVVEHEVAHHHRRDPLWRWVAEIAAAVHWFNPLVAWMARRLAMQCEFACDERVLQANVDANEYAGLLCDLAEEWVPHAPVVAMAERASLENRVRRMMIEGRGPRGMVGVPLMISLALVSATVLALLGSRSEIRAEVSPSEVELRWTADPFPGEAGGADRY